MVFWGPNNCDSLHAIAPAPLVFRDVRKLSIRSWSSARDKTRSKGNILRIIEGPCRRATRLCTVQGGSTMAQLLLPKLYHLGHKDVSLHVSHGQTSLQEDYMGVL